MTGANGFRDRTRLGDARSALVETIEPLARTESIPVAAADGRVLASAVTADRAVPHYERAAVDGYAVVAASTFGASDRSPNVLRVRESEGAPAAVDSHAAVPVHTGSELPPGADAVVMGERVERFGDEIEVAASVTAGENVSPVGEDVERGAECFDAGHRLRPADLGLLRAIGRRRVAVYDRPVVDVVPTGDELVPSDADRAPEPGEAVETNALTVSRYVEAWGGAATERDVVPDDDDRLRGAIDRGVANADLVVTIGGSSVGDRDRVAAVVDDAGTLSHHGLAIRPGHPAGFGVVDDTPILILPGYPVSCIVTATSLLRPALKTAGRLPTTPHPSTTATLDRKVASEPGVRQFVRVALERTAGDSRADPGDSRADPVDSRADLDDSRPGVDADLDAEDARHRAVPLRAAGASVLSSVTDADGWVTIPESVEGVDAGATVAVEDWEYRP